jgi:hypothetical protein
MHDPLPPECEEMYQAQLAAQKQHTERWAEHEAYLQELGAEPGRITMMPPDRAAELKLRTERVESAWTEWQRKVRAWMELCGGMRFRTD